MSKFGSRRKDSVEFKHIAHGLIPAATIAPRPAVPRTPPPRSPFPCPERPRSALAAAILSSSLTGRTVAIPMMGLRSFSESDCSWSASGTTVEPYASAGDCSRDRWYTSLRDRPHLPCSEPAQDSNDEDDDDDDAGEESIERETLSNPAKDHIYESLEKHHRDLVENDVYAVPHKQGTSRSGRSDLTDSSEFTEESAQQAADEIAGQVGTSGKVSSPDAGQNQSTLRTMSSPDLTDDVEPEAENRASSGRKALPSRSSARDPKLEDEEDHQELQAAQQQLVRALRDQNQALTLRCEEQALQLQQAQEQLRHMRQQLERPHHVQDGDLSAGGQVELHALRRQAQELVDENDGLKMTVHHLNVELSRYQARFRPLSKEESSRINALPKKGPTPPWLTDMKYLSPLLLAYEDRLSEKDSLLHTCEEEIKKLRERTEEVVHENEKLHEQLGRAGGIWQKQWRRLQEQATLVLKENQVLMEQLEVQQGKAKESHSCHLQEVSKVTKELMLLEAERQRLQDELKEVCRELEALRGRHQQTLSALEGTIGREEHHELIRKLQRQLEEAAESSKAEVEDLASRMASLQVEKKALMLETANLKAEMKSLETELKASRCAKRKADKKVALMKLQVEDSLEREITAHQYLTGIVALAEKTIQERDQLVHMASTLQQEKQGVLTKIIEGTMRLGKLQEKVKVYKREAAGSLGVMGQRLQEQEEDFAGKAASYQREIRHLQRLLQDKQEALDGALHQKREVEGELETVWNCTSKENQHIKEALFQSLDWTEWSLRPPEELDFTKGTSLGWTSRQCEDLPPLTPPKSSVLASCGFHQSGAVTGLHHSPRFRPDSDHVQNQSSDEGEKNSPDFHS